MQESFEEYIDRVSRAHHLAAKVLIAYDFLRGTSVGYKSSLEYLKGLTDARVNMIREQIENMQGYSQRLALKAKTRAMIVSDRVLTYREEEI